MLGQLCDRDAADRRPGWLISIRAVASGRRFGRITLPDMHLLGYAAPLPLLRFGGIKDGHRFRQSLNRACGSNPLAPAMRHCEPPVRFATIASVIKRHRAGRVVAKAKFHFGPPWFFVHHPTVGETNIGRIPPDQNAYFFGVQPDRSDSLLECFDFGGKLGLWLIDCPSGQEKR
jgi:hypothetical protein